MADAVEARRLGETPATKTPTIIPVFGARKIVGYSSDTGEVRVMDAFEYAPTNGMVYRLFEYDSSANSYKEIEPSFGKVFTKANAKCYNIILMIIALKMNRLSKMVPTLSFNLITLDIQLSMIM